MLASFSNSSYTPVIFRANSHEYNASATNLKNQIKFLLNVFTKIFNNV